jgi:RNA polymerase sigma factor (sigma-70 family)
MIAINHDKICRAEIRHTGMAGLHAMVAEMNKAQNEVIRDAVKQNGKRLFDFIRSRVREPEEAEDIYQDVMYELTSSYRLMQPIEKMAAWLFRVARNKITDQYRKKRPYLLDDQSVGGHEEGEPLYLQDLLKSGEESPDREFDQELLQAAIEEALDELPQDQRDVFIWHELEGKSFREIATLTGQPVNTLLSRKRYAVLRLREKLRELYIELFD